MFQLYRNTCFRTRTSDMVCIGEGEEAFAELLDKMQQGV